MGEKRFHLSTDFRRESKMIEEVNKTGVRERVKKPLNIHNKDRKVI